MSLLENKEHLLINPQIEYERFVQQVHNCLSENDDDQHKLQIIDFLLNVIKKDIQIDLLSEIYYKCEYEIRHIEDVGLIPLKYLDENGIVHRLEPVGKKQIDLSKVVTVVVPWKRQWMKNAIITIANCGFRYKKEEHNLTWYFKELDLCYAKNGNHHFAAGIIQETGCIEADVYTIEQLFPHVKTDGAYWFNIHTGERLKMNIKDEDMEVFDFRVAVLYELAKLKYELLKKTN